MAYFIGIDLGTSAVKLLLVDDVGRVCNTVSREYPLLFPRTGWSEQDLKDWWATCLGGIRARDHSDASGSPLSLMYRPPAECADRAPR